MKKKILTAALLLGCQALVSTAALAWDDGASSIRNVPASQAALLKISQADVGMEDGSGTGFEAVSPEEAQEETKVKHRKNRGNRHRKSYMHAGKVKHKLSRKIKAPETSSMEPAGDACCASSSSQM